MLLHSAETKLFNNECAHRKEKRKNSKLDDKFQSRYFVSRVEPRANEKCRRGKNCLTSNNLTLTDLGESLVKYFHKWQPVTNLFYDTIEQSSNLAPGVDQSVDPCSNFPLTEKLVKHFGNSIALDKYFKDER